MNCAALTEPGLDGAVVADEADPVAIDARMAAHRVAVEGRLEFEEVRAIDDARDDLAHVVGLALVGRDDAQQFLGVVQRRTHTAVGPRGLVPGQGSIRSRAMAMACASFSARYSPRPVTRACSSLPPSSSSVSSPMAAFTSGGPAR
jgi:hypothetical protein